MNLHYKQYGDSKNSVLIILHGLFGTLDNWHTVANKLASDFNVYAIDQRNHGRSPHAESHTYDDLTQDLFDFMQMHGIRSAHLLGHSMGGTVAMQFASIYPEYTRSLIVADIAPKRYSSKHDEVFDALFSIDLKQFSRREEIDQTLALSIPDDAVRLFLMKNISRREKGAFHWKMNLETIKEYYDQIISGPVLDSEVDIPALFIRGGKSKYIVDDDMPDINKYFPRAEVRTINNAGHWLHADAPEEFVKIVLVFLK